MKIVPVVFLLSVLNFSWGQPPGGPPSRRYGYDGMDNGYHQPLGWGPRFGSRFHQMHRGPGDSGNWSPMRPRDASLPPLQRLPAASRGQGPAYFNYQSDEDAVTRRGRSYISDSHNDKTDDFNDVNTSDVDEGGVNVGGIFWTRPRADQKTEEENHTPDCGCNHRQVASLTKDATAAAANAATAAAMAARAAARAAAAAVCSPEAAAEQQEDDADDEEDAEDDDGDNQSAPLQFRTEFPQNRNRNYQSNFRGGVSDLDTTDSEEFSENSPGCTDNEGQSRGTGNSDYSRGTNRRKMNSWSGITGGRNSQDVQVDDIEGFQGNSKREFSLGGATRSEVNSRKRTNSEANSPLVTNSEFSRGSGKRDFSQGIGATWNEVNSRSRIGSEATSQDVNGNEYPYGNGGRDFSEGIGIVRSDGKSRKRTNEENSPGVNDGEKFSRRTSSGRESPLNARKEVNSLRTTDTASFTGVTEDENYSEETTSNGLNSRCVTDEKLSQEPSISSELSQSHTESEMTSPKNGANSQGRTYNSDIPQGLTGSGTNSRRNEDGEDTQSPTGSVIYSQGSPGRGINTQRTAHGLIKSSDDKSASSKNGIHIPDEIKKNFVSTNSSGIPPQNVENKS